MNYRQLVILPILLLLAIVLSGCLNTSTPQPIIIPLARTLTPRPNIAPAGTLLPRFTPHVTHPAPAMAAATATPQPPSASTPIAPTATIPVTPSPLPQEYYLTYKVKPGETLYDIAQKFHVSLQELAKLNQITDPTSIKAGDVLLIP